ncbi:hypothetical protein M1O52_03550 [Dehalococcoidia bacterium]|nr:hypothetical protein [Dehalococcoidia bacterium]
MKKSFRIWFILFLVLVMSLSAGCPQAPDEVTTLSREEAVSIAMEVPEFKEAAELGEIVSSLEGEVWIVKVIQWVGDESIENPVVHINSRTGEIIKVHKVSEIAARKIALLAWWEGRAMIPEQKAIALTEDKGDYWLVTIQIINMFTEEVISENAGQFKVDKVTGRIR